MSLWRKYRCGPALMELTLKCVEILNNKQIRKTTKLLVTQWWSFVIPRDQIAPLDWMNGKVSLRKWHLNWDKKAPIMVRIRPYKGLPWWFIGEESSCQYKRHRQGFDPSSRKIPCTVEQLSLCITTIELSLCSRPREPQLPKSPCPRAPAPRQEKPPQCEAQTLQLERSPSHRE